MKKIKMPTALGIVMIFLALVAVLTWFVPTSVVVDGEIIFNAAFDADGNVIQNAGTSPVGLWDYFLAPVIGLADGVGVAAAIMVSGGLLAVLNKTGALDAGISVLLHKFKGNTLIAILMIVYGLMGTVYGAWEELPAYAIIMVPLFVTAGYDVVTGLLTLMVGAVIGNMAGVVNPYSVGAAVAAIGNDELSLGTGIALRMVLFAVLMVIGIFMVTRYASAVKKDPSKSVVANVADINTRVDGEVEQLEVKMTGRQKASLVVFVIVILLCVVGYMPWDAIPCGDQTMFEVVNGLQFKLQETAFGNFIGANNFTPFGWWYFDEFSTVWLLGAIVIGIVGGLSEKEWVSSFTSGAKDLLGVVLVLAASRGIAHFMGNKTEGMSITFVYWIQNLLSGVPLWAFVIAALAVYILIAFVLQSTSGVAGITMPIFGALAFGLFALSSCGSLGGQALLLSAFTVGINFTCSFYPESTNMGICEMVNMPYPIYVKTILKYTIPLLLVAALIISVAPYVGLV